MFCDVEVNDTNKEALQQRYCEIHNLDVFPTPFAQKPPAPAAPPTDQEGPINLRGGGGEDGEDHSNDGWNLFEDEGSPRTNADATFEVVGSPTVDSQAVGAALPPFTQRNADSPEKRPSQEVQPNDTREAAATEELGVEQTAASSDHTPVAAGQHCPTITNTAPPTSIMRGG